MSLDSITIQQISNICSGKVEILSNDGLDFQKEAQHVLIKILQQAILGKYEITYKPDKPLPDEFLDVFISLGYGVNSDGYVYKINWS